MIDLTAVRVALRTLALELTAREAEVLYWVVKGKTNRDIGDILGTSPRTVTKHLEHVFSKLDVAVWPFTVTLRRINGAPRGDTVSLVGEEAQNGVQKDTDNGERQKPAPHCYR